MSTQKTGNSLYFRLLSDKQLYEIHQATLAVLEKTGVEVHNNDALRLLKKAGANISDTSRVRIPPSLIKRALQSAPQKITIFNRNGEQAMLLKDRNVYYGTGSDCPNTIDPYTGERRLVIKRDIENESRLCDCLSNIDFVMSMGVPSDVPHETSFVHQFEVMVLNTTKPIIFTAHGKEDVRDIFDMAVVVAGSPARLKEKPFIILYAEPISPLIHAQMSIEKVLFCAEHNIPFIYISAPMMGATGPVTLAGSLTLANAEALSGLLISQLKKEGAPYIYGGDVSIMDMKTSIFAYGAPELQVLNIALADLAHYYKLPLFCLSGATDSKVLDSQAGIEYGISLLISTMNGANLIHDLGYLESGLTSSLEAIVMADEAIGMVKRITSGFDINEETLALNVIDRIGPGGNFLTDEHTLKHFKSAHWYPRFMDRENYENWIRLGQKALTDKLNIRVKEILKEHRPEPLLGDRQELVAEIIKKREAAIGKEG